MLSLGPLVTFLSMPQIYNSSTFVNVPRANVIEKIISCFNNVGSKDVCKSGNIQFIFYDFKIILVTPMTDPTVEQSDQCAAPDSPHSK